jgi:hypothetical protein
MRKQLPKTLPLKLDKNLKTTILVKPKFFSLDTLLKASLMFVIILIFTCLCLYLFNANPIDYKNFNIYITFCFFIVIWSIYTCIICRLTKNDFLTKKTLKKNNNRSIFFYTY